MKRTDPMMFGIAGVFCLAGVAMIWFAILQFQGTDAFLDKARETNGIVVENPITCTTRNTRSDGTSTTGSTLDTTRTEEVCTYRPVLEFTSVAGVAERKPVRYGRGSYDFEVGEELRIFVNSERDFVLLAAEHNQNEVGVVLLVFGSLLCLPMVLVMLFVGRGRRK